MSAIPQFLLWGFLISSFLVFLGKNKKVIAFCLIFMVLGIWSHQKAVSKALNNDLTNYNDSGKEIVLTGTIIGEPDARENSQKLTIKPEDISGYENKEWERVLVSAGKYPEYKYGDKLEIKGKMETPAAFEDFNYKDYLVRQGIYSVIYWSDIKLLEREKYVGLTSAVYAKVLDFKNQLRKVICADFSPPQSSILGAMILGDNNRMPDDLKERLNISGIRHITAVSGTHIVILSGILMSLLLGLGFWRGQAFYFSIIIIFLYIIMIGAPSSAVRAGIMGGLYLLGQKIGRKSFSPRAIILAGAIMLAFNPLLLMADVGFQLSFLAVAGMIYFNPFFERKLKMIPDFMGLRTVLATTLSAHIFTLPIIIYNFGRVPLFSLLTNLLVLPIIYWIMIFGFAFVLLGSVWGLLARVLSFPLWLLLTYFTEAMNLFSQPWAAKTIENIHWVWLVFSYAILSLLACHLNKKEKLRFLTKL